MVENVIFVERASVSNVSREARKETRNPVFRRKGENDVTGLRVCVHIVCAAPPNGLHTTNVRIDQ